VSEIKFQCLRASMRSKIINFLFFNDAVIIVRKSETIVDNK